MVSRLTLSEVERLQKKRTFIRVGKMSVQVKIKNFRNIFDRAELLIQPAQGTGETWINVNNVHAD